MPQLVCIVEGQSEEESLPLLVRRVVADVSPGFHLHVHRPFRISRSKFIKFGEAERLTDLACRKLTDRGALLVVMDADDDCPARLGPALTQRCRLARPALPVYVVLAKFEWENWFIAASNSLVSVRGLSSNLPVVANPESIRDAKGWLTNYKTGPHTYSPVLDQPGLTQRMDVGQARRADSFDKFYRDLTRLIIDLASTIENA